MKKESLGQNSAYQTRRKIKDILARYIIRLGGLSTIVAISLIFFYLLYEVWPLFKTAEVQQNPSTTQWLRSAKTLQITLEDKLLLASHISTDGKMTFFKPGASSVSGTPIKQFPLALPDKVGIKSVFKTEPGKDESDNDTKKTNSEVYIAGLTNGSALIFESFYISTFDKNTKRSITPHLNYPWGKNAIKLGDDSPVVLITGESNEEGYTIVSLHESGNIFVTRIEKSTSLLDEEDESKAPKFTVSHSKITPGHKLAITHLVLSKDMRSLYIANKNGGLSYYNLADPTSPQLVQYLPTVNNGHEITSLKLLIGGISLLIGNSDGSISQWFPVKIKTQGKTKDEVANKTVIRLKKIREFTALKAPIRDISVEYTRKGFAAIDQSGTLGIFHTTAHRTLSIIKTGIKDPKALYLSPRADAVLIDNGKQIHGYSIKNDHPEISWSVLWNKVWYESRSKPLYIWQSSASSDDAEPKLSLIPLTTGTLKAAFYAMLISIPLAIFGAIFTAHFMAPRMRRIVKPGIEIMEALPTVVIGFLAALWLAPIVDANLAGVFLIIITMPVGIVLFGYLWERAPRRMRHAINDGWEAALLIPVIIFIAWFTLSVLGPLFDSLFFHGSMSHWLAHELEIPYSRHNSMIVGLAMGFAVIPTIFSIAEDAIFAVPKYLVQGSLALGATAWQTLTRVVILTASPGIFSAVMIGFGRAIGETMIVLMATGNTPITDMNILTGMRTLSANIATELPEAARHSTHFRVLFLTALVLFIFTFIFNSIAEIVRHRLRNKYSSL